MLASRRKAPVHTHSVWIQLNLPSLKTDTPAAEQAAGRVFVVFEVIKFLIVNRGLASNTVDALNKAVSAYREEQASRNSRSRGASAIRRAEQFLTALSHISTSLADQLFVQGSSAASWVNQAVAVALGPSPGRARELYTIRFADATSPNIPQQPLTARSYLQAANPREESASRQLIKCLLQEYSALPPWQDTVPQGTKLQVLVHGAPSIPASLASCSAAAASSQEELPDVEDNHSDQDNANAAMMGHPAVSNRPIACSQPPIPLKARFSPAPHLSNALSPSTCRVSLQVEIIIACRKLSDHLAPVPPPLAKLTWSPVTTAATTTGHKEQHQGALASPSVLKSTPLQQQQQQQGQHGDDVDQQDVVSCLSAATAALSMQPTPSVGKPSVSSRATAHHHHHHHHHHLPHKLDDAACIAIAHHQAPTTHVDQAVHALAWVPARQAGSPVLHAYGEITTPVSKTSSCCLGIIPAALPNVDAPCMLGDVEVAGGYHSRAGVGSCHVERLWWQCGVGVKGLPMPKQN